MGIRNFGEDDRQHKCELYIYGPKDLTVCYSQCCCPLFYFTFLKLAIFQVIEIFSAILAEEKRITGSQQKKTNFQIFFVRLQMLVLKTIDSIPSTQSESFIEGALLNQPSLFKKLHFAVTTFEGILDFGIGKSLFYLTKIYLYLTYT